MSSSVLIITNSDDRRHSTRVLRRIASALEEVGSPRVSVFMLRPSPDSMSWPNHRVVDTLRTWPPAAIVERVVSPGLAGRMRGLRLRWWLRQAHPDLVILDDGLGFRVIEHLADSVVVVNRINEQAPPDAFDDVAAFDRPDLVIAPTDLEVTTSVPVIREHRFKTFRDAARFADPAVRAATRGRLGLPEDVTLITGWGGDGWLDGPDLFIRLLWSLQDRYGIAVHGAWFGTDHPAEVRRLTEEATRCGVAERYSILPYDGRGEMPEGALCADAIALPTRASLLADHLVPATVSGLTTVTFRAAEVEDDHVWCVDDLDIDAMAAALIRSLDQDRSAQSHEMMLQIDIGAWSRHLLELAADLRHRP